MCVPATMGALRRHTHTTLPIEAAIQVHKSLMRVQVYCSAILHDIARDSEGWVSSIHGCSGHDIRPKNTADVSRPTCRRSGARWLCEQLRPFKLLEAKRLKDGHLAT